MTVKQLIEQLSKYPDETLVICTASEDDSTPMVIRKKYEFEHTIYDTMRAKFVTLPVYTEVITL